MPSKWSSPEAREVAVAGGVEDPEQAIRNLVRQLLAEHGLQSVPVPLQRLFGWANVRRVKQQEMLLEGGLKRNEDGSFDIIVRADRPASRQRFSLAHELGHTLFHAYAPRAKRAREARHEVAPQEEERLCNVAAEELLMPHWYVRSRAGSSASAADLVAELSRCAEVSPSAALIRAARYCGASGEVQLWDRRDETWSLSIARRTGRQRQALSEFVVEAWDGQAPPRVGLPWRGVTFLYAASRRLRIRAETVAIPLHGHGDSVLVSHAVAHKAARATSTSFERARFDRLKRALVAPARADCPECGGSGLITASVYNVARRADPPRMCECRYGAAPKVSA